MSWVEKLASGRFRAVYRDDAGGRHSKTFDKRATAKAWLAAAATDRARPWAVGRPVGRGDLPRRLGRAVVRRPQRAAHHPRQRPRPLQPAPRPGLRPRPAQDLSPMRVRGFVAELATRRSPSTVRNVHSLLSQHPRRRG